MYGLMYKEDCGQFMSFFLSRGHLVDCYDKSNEAILKPTPTIRMQYFSDHFNGSGRSVESGRVEEVALQKKTGNLLWLELAGNG